MLRVVTPERNDNSSMVKDSGLAAMTPRIAQAVLDRPWLDVTRFGVTIADGSHDHEPGAGPLSGIRAAGASARRALRFKPGADGQLASHGAARHAHHELAVVVLPRRRAVLH